MNNALALPSITSLPRSVARRLGRLASHPWNPTRAQRTGHAIEALAFLSRFQSHAGHLAFLIFPRLVALVVPAYILFKGRGVEAAVNFSVVASFALNAAWHAGHYVYA